MNTNKKFYIMKIKTLSPVFIADGVPILNIKNEEDFRKILESRKDLNEKWIEYFLNDRDPSFVNFLRKNIGEDYLYKQFGYKPNKKSNDFVKSAKGYFIPGSSIKGAISTAIMADKINKYPKNPGIDVLKEVKNSLKQKMQYVQISDSDFIEEKHFKESPIIHKKIIHDFEERSDLGLDKRKFLMPGVEMNFTLGIEKGSDLTLEYILSCLKDYYGKVLEENTADLYGENVKPTQTVKLSPEEIKKKQTEVENKIALEKYKKLILPNATWIKIKTEAKEKHPELYPITVNDKPAQNQAQQAQIITIYDEKSGLKPNINLGGQSGFNTKNVLRALSDDNTQKYIQKKKEILAKCFWKHKHNDPNMPKAPRYLKTAFGYTIGWCNIQEAK